MEYSRSAYVQPAQVARSRLEPFSTVKTNLWWTHQIIGIEWTLYLVDFDNLSAWVLRTYKSWQFIFFFFGCWRFLFCSFFLLSFSLSLHTFYTFCWYLTSSEIFLGITQEYFSSQHGSMDCQSSPKMPNVLYTGCKVKQFMDIAIIRDEISFLAGTSVEADVRAFWHTILCAYFPSSEGYMVKDEAPNRFRTSNIIVREG